MGGDDDMDCSDYDSEEGSDSDENDGDNDNSRPRIVGETVGRRVTVENVGHVSLNVESQTKPLQFLNFPFNENDAGEGEIISAFRFAIKNNDLKTLRFLLDRVDQFTSKEPEADDDMPDIYSFPDADFKYAIQQGHTELLAEIIRRTGAGLPLETLVKNSGVELVEKPRSYQGLTVYGRKRTDWATEGRGVVTMRAGTETSPLIIAAMAGCIESVEWFLSDAPLRHYLDFSKSEAARKDARLKHLAEAPGGFDGAVISWIKEQIELIIHAAIMGHPCDKSNKLVEYLIKAFPASIEAKSKSGATPLFLASYLGRTDMAKLLIDAGADQSCKDSQWQNILHVALSTHPTASELGALLDLFDPRLVSRMCSERNSIASGGRTPVHQWLVNVVAKMPIADTRYRCYKTTAQVAAVFKQLVRRGGGQTALEVLDSAGMTPLHDLAASGVQGGAAAARIFRAVLDAAGDPGALLRREDAVGRTPVEVARDSFVAARVAHQGSRCPRHTSVDAVDLLIASRPEVFATAVGGVWRASAPVDDGEEKSMDVDDTNRDEEEDKEEDEDEDDDDAVTSFPDEFCGRYNYSPGQPNCLNLRAAAGSIWETCVDYAERYPAPRRLVGLHEANDVARRLDGKHVEARYAFKVDRPAGTAAANADDDDKAEADKKDAAEKRDIVDLHWSAPPHPTWGAASNVVLAWEDRYFCRGCSDYHQVEIKGERRRLALENLRFNLMPFQTRE